MALINAVTTLCRKLAKHGWSELFEAHGLAIDRGSPADLERELLRRPLPIKRELRGFEDFAADGTRGIEPGSPAQSLLYHALASPNVLNDPHGKRLRYFPTPAELECVENYVFGVRPPTMQQLLVRAKAARLTVVVFACEYRPAAQTCHGRHADMVYSRTGVARVGTASPLWRPELRGYLPELNDDAFAIRVSPSRFAAYLAVQKKGSPDTFVPMRFQSEKPQDAPAHWVPDDKRLFWIPVQKLFDGSECIKGITVQVSYETRHVNEKLRRIHLALQRGKKGKRRTRAEAAVPQTPPFSIEQGLAELSSNPADGAGMLIPIPHPRLVEPAILPDGTPATYRVPRNSTVFSAFEPSGGAPAYVHARTEVRNGVEFDLNRESRNPDVLARVRRGGYLARHYLDFTADGWVNAKCKGLTGIATVDADVKPGYSLVTAPDFFPSCDQRQLTEWAKSNAVPEPIRGHLWSTEPDVLSDQRYPPNLHLPDNPFSPNEATITALVPLFGTAPKGLTHPTNDALRHSHLPDDAAGVFAPGWDVGVDEVRVAGSKVQHLAAYRLGSPFPEDSKLCAALSTFWPAVAPDATREMEPVPEANASGTVCPLTDEEIGQIGTTPWDGVGGPIVVRVGGQEFAEFPSFQHADYVRTALAGRFSMRLTARVEAEEYKRRVLAMAFGHLVLHVERTGKAKLPKRLLDERSLWIVLSFMRTTLGMPELIEAQAQASTILPGPSYSVVAFERAKLDKTNRNLRRPRMPIAERYSLFVDPVNRLALVRRSSETTWRRGTLLV